MFWSTLSLGSIGGLIVLSSHPLFVVPIGIALAMTFGAYSELSDRRGTFISEEILHHDRDVNGDELTIDVRCYDNDLIVVSLFTGQTKTNLVKEWKASKVPDWRRLKSLESAVSEAFDELRKVKERRSDTMEYFENVKISFQDFVKIERYLEGSNYD